MKKLLIGLALCLGSLVAMAQTSFTLDVVAEGNYGTTNGDVFRRSTTGATPTTSTGLYQAANSTSGFNVLQDFVVNGNKAIIAEKPSGTGRVVIASYPSLAHIITFSTSHAPQTIEFASTTKAYVSMGSPSGIEVIDLINNTMTPVSDPSNYISTYSDNMEYASGIIYVELGSKIAKIDTATNIVIDTIEPGIGAIKGMQYDPQSNKLWLLNGSGTIVSVDIANADAIGPTISTGASSTKLLRTYNGKLYFWSNKNMYIYNIANPSTLPLTASYTSSLAGGSWSFAYGRSFSIDQNTGDFAICSAGGFVAPGLYEVVDGSTFTVIESGSIAGCAIPNKCVLKTFSPANPAPIPDVASLPTITEECSATVTAPTANNGTITGTTTDPTTYSSQGTYSITWTYTSGGQNVTQTQTVIINDSTDPVADISPLDTVWLNCNEEITVIPTATDNCAGLISGATSDPLSYSINGTYSITWNYSDNNGNSISQNQIVIVSCDQTGINELIGLNYDIYPNPVKGFITINSKNSPFSGSILNSYGQKVLSIEKTNSLTKRIDIRNLSNGIYFLQLIDAEGSFFTKKIIVQQ